MKPLNQWNFSDVLEFAKTVDKKTWGRISAIAAAVLLVLVFFVIPAWIERPLLRRDLESMEGQIRNVTALSLKQASWEEDQKVYNAVIQGVQNRLFDVARAESLLGRSSKLADESHVDVLASKPLVDKLVFPAPYQLKYGAYGYEFSLLGGYHDLGQLVSRIENSEFLLRIKSLRILPSEKSPDRHIAELRFWAIVSMTPSNASDTAPVAGVTVGK